ncbi:MAG: RNA polymerase sigma-70 factor [Cytophagaceae bacterium]|jgi:RNA polymerase sigma-70 factor (ECF subfamily)|nr:RNA polymerase sigma-70 factor [Cytophagaceae bacterium]
MSESIDINELKAGKHETYERMFAGFYVSLCSYACSILKDSEEAEDVVQKTFCLLWDRRNDIEIRTSVKSYLYRIVHNECMNRMRRIKIRSQHDRIYADSKDEQTNSTEENYLGLELDAVIRKAIDTLPPRCREVFVKSRMEQLSYSEIAEAMNISANTVENQMAKALRTLREILKEYMTVVWLLFFLHELNR